MDFSESAKCLEPVGNCGIGAEICGAFADDSTDLACEDGCAAFASASCSRSSRSVSRRPFDGRTSYPECPGSAFHAVIFAVTRTTDFPEALPDGAGVT